MKLLGLAMLKPDQLCSGLIKSVHLARSRPLSSVLKQPRPFRKPQALCLLHRQDFAAVQ
jgi:hypothetical protein